MGERIYGFAPVFRPDARVLILGSMPSIESLNRSFYYAHPRNAFWPMMAEILNENMPQSTEEKKAMLIRHGIALWDTVGSCEREGSLDSAIRDARPNDFKTLFAACPQIRHIFFNGAAAQQLYLKLVSRDDGRIHHCMPSTSPAYAVKYEYKLEKWKQALKEALNESL